MTPPDTQKGAPPWFERPLTLLGVMFMMCGGAFFVFVASVGAPIVPFGGLAVALLGLWIAVIRPMRRSDTPPQSG